MSFPPVLWASLESPSSRKAGIEIINYAKGPERNHVAFLTEGGD